MLKSDLWPQFYSIQCNATQCNSLWDTICKLMKHLSKMSLSTCLFALETFWWIKISWIEFQISKFHELSYFVSFCFISVLSYSLYSSALKRRDVLRISYGTTNFWPGITFIFYTLISHVCSYFMDLLSFFYCDTQQWTENCSHNSLLLTHYILLSILLLHHNSYTMPEYFQFSSTHSLHSRLRR